MLAGADELVARLPRGYDTMLGDAGQGLSGGEIQRIALARAFLKPADLLVLDEPAAGLDAALADRIAESVRLLSATRATLVIAHDEASVRHADQVLVLDAGRLVRPPLAAVFSGAISGAIPGVIPGAVA